MLFLAYEALRTLIGVKGRCSRSTQSILLLNRELRVNSLYAAAFVAILDMKEYSVVVEQVYEIGIELSFEAKETCTVQNRARNSEFLVYMFCFRG